MSARSEFIVGRDIAGRWIAVDFDGLRGGYFRDQQAAVAFAKQEANSQPNAVTLVNGTLDLFLRLNDVRQLRTIAHASPDNFTVAGSRAHLARSEKSLDEEYEDALPPCATRA